MIKTLNLNSDFHLMSCIFELAHYRNNQIAILRKHLVNPFCQRDNFLSIFPHMFIKALCKHFFAYLTLCIELFKTSNKALSKIAFELAKLTFLGVIFDKCLNYGIVQPSFFYADIEII